ncbi:hypothetical protein BGZ98_005252 [Dissophora globulifera]|uniref:Uncharacterized protein n=1 Tax=Dissophora globulifera TaxID=979702 RepID=A0A9P6UPX1_9FUNG|nr:hypothetical protein BGZ98_005252 [Dissophora globulifera]KAG0314286.1 hypothetical protein BGZ99_008227 [Dissophora globulifera]
MQFKEFDAFPKVESGFVKRTGSGGILTLVISAILCVLVVGEIKDYMTLRNDYRFLVDPLVNHELQINLDVTVAMPCEALTIDLRDIADVQLRLSDKVQKIPTHFTVGSMAHSESIRKKPLNVQKLIRAASRTAALEQASKQADQNFKACRIAGSFEANKLSGNMHITAVGHGYPGAHLDHNVMNMTHKIDELSFGALYPTIVNPLDDSFEISKSSFEAFQYFLVVVPTIYVDRSKRELLTNQYSVSEYRRTFGDDQGVPGLFFKYDFEPMTLMITEESTMSFGHLLVRLAGLVGGYYVTAGMAYKVLSAAYYSVKPEQASLKRHNV